MKYFILLFFMFLSAATTAQTRDFDGYTQTDMNLNALKSYQEWNARMMDLCDKIIMKESSDKLFVDNFKKSQKKWEEWREFEINAFYPNYPDSREFYGSMQPLCRYSKLIDWTEERINQLQIYLEGVKNEDACGPGRD